MIPPVAISFLKSYWKEAIGLAIIATLLIYVQFLRIQRDNISLSFTNYQLAAENAVKQREIEIKVKDEQSNQRASINEQIYAKEIAKQQAEIRRLGGNVAGLVDINSGLRNAAEDSRRELSKLLTDSRLPAESGTVCDTSASERKYRTLELACVQTTIDYNALRKWADDQCEIYGCR